MNLSSSHIASEDANFSNHTTYNTGRQAPPHRFDEDVECKRAAAHRAPPRGVIQFTVDVPCGTCAPVQEESVETVPRRRQTDTEGSDERPLRDGEKRRRRTKSSPPRMDNETVPEVKATTSPPINGSDLGNWTNFSFVDNETVPHFSTSESDIDSGTNFSGVDNETDPEVKAKTHESASSLKVDDADQKLNLNDADQKLDWHRRN